MHLIKTAAMALLFFAPIQAFAAPAYPPLQGKPVVDAANIIPDSQEAALNAKLFAYEKHTGHQLMVATVPGLDGYTIADYAQGYFRTLRLGHKDRDDGALFLIAPKEHKARIHTGYGMQTILTDLQAKLILEHKVIPEFKVGNIPAGIDAGVDQIIKETTPLTPEEQALVQRQEAKEHARSAAAWAKFKDFLLSVLGFSGTGLLGYGLYRVVTAPERRRQREAAVAKAEAARKAQERVEAQEEAARAEQRRRDTERYERERQAAIAAREKMLAAMSPAARSAFLDREEQDRKESEKRARLAEERRRAEEVKEAEARRKQEEEDEQESSSYSSYNSSSDDSGSSWDSGFSGGGGDSGGSGADSSW